MVRLPSRTHAGKVSGHHRGACDMVITAGIVRRQHAIVRAFQQAAATTPATACSAKQLGLKPGLAWHHLVGHAVLRCPGEGRYFLDLPNWQRLRRKRRRIAAVMVTIVLLGGALAWWLAVPR
jgi:hypothetical protein